jgi:hypothetical protein
MATDHRHPQPPEAPQAPDNPRRGLKGPQRAQHATPAPTQREPPTRRRRDHHPARCTLYATATLSSGSLSAEVPPSSTFRWRAASGGWRLAQRRAGSAARGYQSL